MNLTFNQSGTATLWGSNKLKGDNTTSTYIPSVSFNSGVNVLNNNNALYAPTAPNVYLGATSGGNPTTLLLGGPTAGTEGGITISTALNNNTLVVQYGNSGTVTIGGQNTSGVNIWGCNFTLGSGANNGKSVTLLAATGGEVDFTGAFLKNGSDTTAGITVGDATHGGTVKITGANTYGGGTTVSGGKLLVNNTSGSGTGSGAVTVQNTATLGGSGTISGAVTVNSGGTLSPGVTTIGTLTINNNLTLSGVANFRLNKTGSTLTSDQVAGATSVTAGGTLNVTASGDALADGDTFTLFNVTPGSAFAVTNLPSTTSANWWTTNNFRTLIYNLWPTAGNTNFTHKKGIPVRFSVADLLARVSGATSGKTITVTSLGNPTVSGATVQTNGSLSSSSTLILYTPGSSDANDSFAYTISDGHGGSPSGTVYLTADTSTVFGQQSPQLTADGNGNIKVTFFGVPGYTYTIQRSATVDFSSPTDLITQTATTGNPVITCTDTISPSGQAYYRLKWQP